jgi:hypothetical protein
LKLRPAASVSVQQVLHRGKTESGIYQAEVLVRWERISEIIDLIAVGRGGCVDVKELPTGRD